MTQIPAASYYHPSPCNPKGSVDAGAFLTAYAFVGDNGTDGEAPELLLEQGIQSSQTDLQWDSDLSDGLDSGLVSVQLIVQSGQSSWTASVGGTPYAVQLSTTLQYITKVQLRARSTSLGQRFSWQSVSIRYVRSNSAEDVYVVPDECPPIADPAGDSGADKVEELQPSHSDVVKIILTAQIRLESSATTLPDGQDIAGEIHVFATTA